MAPSAIVTVNGTTIEDTKEELVQANAEQNGRVEDEMTPLEAISHGTLIYQGKKSRSFVRCAWDCQQRIWFSKYR